MEQGRWNNCGQRFKKTLKLSDSTSIHAALFLELGDRICLLAYRRLPTQAERAQFKGAYRGRLAVRACGSFVIQPSRGNVETSWKHCKLLTRNDGYTYEIKQALIPPLRPRKRFPRVREKETSPET